MPRNIPQCPDRVQAQEPARLLHRSWRIELVTPMFGGGVVAGEPDRDMPVRATEIRGQLRFWWRATRGAQCRSCEELRDLEDDIWGSTEKASRVIVRIEEPNFPEPQSCAEYNWEPNAHGGGGRWRLRWREPFRSCRNTPYVLFPFQGKQPPPNRNARIESPPSKCFAKGSFKLVLQYPKEVSDDVLTALRAWLWFGGLGARTRRGCGALWCNELAPTDSEDFQRALTRMASAERNSSASWPTLARDVLVGPKGNDPLKAWDHVIGLLKELRQGIGVGRNPRGNPPRPGRSRWPEAESVREITGFRSAARPRQPHIPADAFPRADFGLPIVFHFKDRGDPPGNRNADDFTLYPRLEDADRMASPLILKPLKFKNGFAVPLIVVLQTALPSSVELRQGNERTVKMPPGVRIRHPDLANYQHSPLRNTKSGSALEAFVEFAQQNDYRRLGP